MSSIVTREDWISALPVEPREAVTAALRLTHFSRGERITEAGRAAMGIHRLRSGIVKLIGAYPDGRDALITLYAPGAVFSETALVAARPYGHTKIAATDCEVEVLDRDAFFALYARHPAIPEALCRKFARVISRQLVTREQRDTRSLKQRVGEALLDLGDGVGVPEGAGVRIGIPFSQTELGAHLGVTRQSVQKEITSFKRQGLLSRTAAGWLVTEPARLRELIFTPS